MQLVEWGAPAMFTSIVVKERLSMFWNFQEFLLKRLFAWYIVVRRKDNAWWEMPGGGWIIAMWRTEFVTKASTEESWNTGKKKDASMLLPSNQTLWAPPCSWAQSFWHGKQTNVMVMVSNKTHCMEFLALGQLSFLTFWGLGFVEKTLLSATIIYKPPFPRLKDSYGNFPKIHHVCRILPKFSNFSLIDREETFASILRHDIVFIGNMNLRLFHSENQNFPLLQKKTYQTCLTSRAYCKLFFPKTGRKFLQKVQNIWLAHHLCLYLCHFAIFHCTSWRKVSWILKR